MSGSDDRMSSASDGSAAEPADSTAEAAGQSADAAGPGAGGAPGSGAGDAAEPTSDAADPWLALDEPGASPTRVDALARERLGRFAIDDVRRSAGLTSWLVRRAAADGSTTLDGTTWAAALRGYGIERPRPGLDAAVSAGRVVALSSERALAHPRWGPLEGRIADGVRRLLGSDDGSAAVGSVAVGPEAAGPEAVDTGPAAPAGAAPDGIASPDNAAPASAAPDGAASDGAASDDTIARALATPVSVVVAGPGTAPEGWIGILRRRADAAGRSLTVVDDAHRLDLASAGEMLVRHENAGADHLVLVGDPDELEPAGPGRFLGDLVESRSVATIRLPVDTDRGPIVRLVESLRAGELPPVEAGQHDLVVSPVADAAQAVARVVELVTEALPRVLGVGPSDLLTLGIRASGAAGVDALREAVGSECDVAAVHDAVGRRAEAVVLVLPAESAGSLTRAHLISAAAIARRHLSIVHQAGPALAAAVRLRPHRHRRTRLARLLSG